jgi:hypothetical protein
VSFSELLDPDEATICGGSFLMFRNTTEVTEMDRNGQKWTEMDRNGQKRVEIGKTEQKIDRNGQK